MPRVKRRNSSSRQAKEAAESWQKATTPTRASCIAPAKESVDTALKYAFRGPSPQEGATFGVCG